MKKRRLLLVAAFLISVLAACTEADDTKDKTEEAKETPVEVTEAKEDSLTVVRTAYARAEANRLTPVSLESPGELESIDVKEGTVVKKDDVIATIKTPVGNQTIRASKAGTIVNLQAETGDMVSGEDPLAMLADLDKMKLTFTISAALHSKLKVDDELDVELSDKAYKAKVTHVASMPNDTGLFPVEVTVKTEDKDILIGTVAKVNIPVTKVKKAIIIPSEAIVDEGDASYIFIVRDHHAEKLEVEVLESQSSQSAIKGDVQAADEIVTSGMQGLEDGDKIKVVGVEG